MKSNLTELVFIIDRSGSMHGLEGDTVGGFNATLEKQRALEGEVLVSTILFDHTFKVLHDRVSLNLISEMTEKDYCVGGSTALMDALGNTINHIGTIHKYAREEDIPEHTVFVIITDGMENSSRSFDSEQIKDMIEEKKNRNGWEFIFLAANIDAASSAEKIGIDRTRTADYKATHAGTEEVYSMACRAISFKREARDLSSEEWKSTSEKKKK